MASGGTSPDTVALSAAGLPDGGLALAPAGPFDPPITHRSATLGDPFGPGATRAYQVVDRDDAGGFCPPGSFNATNAVRVSW